MRIILFSRDRELFVLKMQPCPFLANSLKVCVLNLMRSKEIIEDLISSSLTEILKRSLTLDRKDQIAIHQEFKITIGHCLRDRRLDIRDQRSEIRDQRSDMRDH